MAFYHERPAGLAKAMAKLSKNAKLQESIRQIAKILPVFEGAIETIRTKKIPSFNKRLKEVKKLLKILKKASENK